jgi:riboflavin kinase/FMN adenylyltransferase
VKVVQGIAALPAGLRFTATLGVFDGVHRGHQRVLRETVVLARAQSATALALTFDPHPALVLRGACPPLLCGLDERLAHFARLGIEVAVVQPFDRDLAGLGAAEFIARLRARRVLVGFVMSAESAFGRDRGGTLAAVRLMGAEHDFTVRQAPDVNIGGERISSGRIRTELGAGRLAAVRHMLGRSHAVAGEVVVGDRRGRELGFPTANLQLVDSLALPPDGIYAARAGWGGRDPLSPEHTRDGVISLGVRPTFGGGARTLEVFLFDFEGDLYGQRLRVEFVRRLRGEKNFASAAALIGQMELDAARARRVLDSARL